MDMSKCSLFEKKLSNKCGLRLFKPPVPRLKIFGCMCYALIPTFKRNKLERRAQPVSSLLVTSVVRKCIRSLIPLLIKCLKNQEGDCYDDLLIRGTRPIFEIYDKCNVAVLEPVSYEEAIMEDF
ncbi:pleiotropic drug resistance protein 3-like [Gossypium australe]|uniref:Pleiotropic drug resistance protein 3-like n=1 Tax=Gossypium australe TaxID=47621 RepID=A0A5B6WRK8_9ROSI|nr:pleiotropic drug resistance protein 3-like [Gossypium australe]